MLAKNQKTMFLNTGMLYIRMFFVMGVTLYTSRLALSMMGAEDFGTYHVVAGFVVILGFLHGAMTTATQRYFSFELGKKDTSRLSEVFSTSIAIHILLVSIIIIFAETLGYWFVSNKLTFPKGSFDEAMLAYHFSVVTFAFTVLIVPFTALIMSYERMGVFAIISVIDVALKLLAVFSLQFFAIGKLSGYAGLLAAVSLITWLIYVCYCKKAFTEVRYQWLWNKQLFKGMLSYTAWNTWGNLASVASGQGTNILLNMFFGPSVNAARAIAFQANTALVSFIQSVQSAINPQIIKLYASKDYKQMHGLVLAGSRYSFLLLMLLAYPVLLNTEILLSIWLVEVPKLAVVFLQMVIIKSLIDSLSGSLMTAAQATGHIKLYQTLVGGVLLFNLPISFWFLKASYNPQSVFVVAIACSLVALILRLILLKKLINLSLRNVFIKVLLKVFVVSCMSSVLAKFFYFFDNPSLIERVFLTAFSWLCLVVITLLIGLEKKEQFFLFNKAKDIAFKNK